MAKTSLRPAAASSPASRPAQLKMRRGLKANWSCRARRTAGGSSSSAAGSMAPSAGCLSTQHVRSPTSTLRSPSARSGATPCSARKPSAPACPTSLQSAIAARTCASMRIRCRFPAWSSVDWKRRLLKVTGAKATGCWDSTLSGACRLSFPSATGNSCSIPFGGNGKGLRHTPWAGSFRTGGTAARSLVS